MQVWTSALLMKSPSPAVWMKLAPFSVSPLSF